MADSNPMTELFGEVISRYTLDQAIEDGVLMKVGEFAVDHRPIIFTTNLFADVKERYQEVIRKGIELLKKPSPEDDEYMKLRVIEKGKIWVVLNAEGCTFMKPEDY